MWLSDSNGFWTALWLIVLMMENICIAEVNLSENTFVPSGDSSSADPAPVVLWTQCDQSAPASNYLNFTFLTYPMKRGEEVKLEMKVYLEPAIEDGTVLKISTRMARFPFFPGPSVKIDICDLVETTFKTSPAQIKCPMNAWAAGVLLNRINQLKKESAEKAPLESSSGVLGNKIVVSRWAIPGPYNVYVQLKGPNSLKPITCAQTTVTVE